MPVIDQNQDPVDRNSLGLDISSFISEYEYPLTLQWVIEHSCYFYMEIAKMLCDVQNELKCIYNPDMQLESVVKNVITVSYTNNKNIKVFMAHFIERFKKQFLEFLKQCEKNVQFLQKTVLDNAGKPGYYHIYIWVNVPPSGRFLAVDYVIQVVQ